MSYIVNLGEPKITTARKDHECGLCHRKISAGEKYLASRHVYDGRAYTWKTCAHCEAFRKLTTLGDYLLDVGSDEGFGHDDVEWFEPSNRRECVLKSQWERGWRNYAGTVASVPRHSRSWIRAIPADTCPLVPIPA